MTLGVTLIYDDLDGKVSEAYRRYSLLARELESAGVEVLWLTEHHHNATRVSPSIPLMMAHLGMQTSLKLGAATILLSLQDPLRIAEEMAVLENLYPDRCIWGFAKGGGSEVLHNHLEGIHTPEAARAALCKNLEALIDLRAGGTAAALPPVPSLSPAGRYYLASRDPDTVRFAARNDLGLMIGHKWRLAEVEHLRGLYRQSHPKGVCPEIMMSRFFHLGESVEAAVDESVAIMGKRHEKMHAAGRALTKAKEIDRELLGCESLIGSADVCMGRMEKFRELGVTHLTLRPLEKNTAVIGRSVRAVTERLTNQGNDEP